MKVVIVNAYNMKGGAARAARRLHKGLLTAGVDSYLVVQTKEGGDFTEIGATSRTEKIFARFRPFLDRIGLQKYKNRSQTLFSQGRIGDGKLVGLINSLGADVVHLHWINEGFLSINEISKIKAPIAWSLHDMWPFTGGCHYDEWCGAFTTGCGKCKVLQSNHENDLSKTVFKKKQRVYNNANITVIGLSSWLANEARRSQLFFGKKIVNLPNPIDAKEFSPLDKEFSRKLFNLPADKKIVLFGAMGATSDPRKGFEQLEQALKFVYDDCELVIFGADKPKTSQQFKQNAHYLGILNDNQSLRALYCAADVMVVPSMQENLSNAIMESLACGTPVAAFDIGGNSDMIIHNTNGYLATAFDANDLAIGINWLLSMPNNSETVKKISEELLNRFTLDTVIPQYLALYNSMIGKTNV